MSEAASDTALDAALDTALELDYHENDLGRLRLGSQSRLDIADEALADGVTSVPYQAEIAIGKGYGHVEDGPPAEPSSAATILEST